MKNMQSFKIFLFSLLMVNIYGSPLLVNDDLSYELDGDIILYDDNDYYEYNDAVSSSDRLWKKIDENVIIPYTISQTASDFEKSQIDRAITEYHQKTCIRFTPRKQENDYIHLNTESLSCRSTMGRKGGKQTVRIGNCKTNGIISWGRIAHELMHVAGFMHEQNRNDAPDYIEVDYDAIKKVEEADGWPTGKLKKQFRKCSLTKAGKKWGCKKIGNYDGNSILHYAKKFGDELPTNIFTPIRNCSNGECEYGQRLELSPGDVKDIEILYKCGMKYDQCQDLYQDQKTDICELVDCNNLIARLLCSDVCSKKTGSFCQKLIINSTKGSKEWLNSVLGSYEYHSIYSDSGKNMYRYIGRDDTFLSVNSLNEWQITNEINTTESYMYNSKCTASYPERCSSSNWKYYNDSASSWFMDNSITVECESTQCCLELVINGTGPAKEFQSAAFGIYEYHSMANSKNVYKHIEEEYYLFFSSIRSWMITSKKKYVGTDTGVLYSPNFVTSCPEKSDRSNWKARSSSSWIYGNVVTVECL